MPFTVDNKPILPSLTASVAAPIALAKKGVQKVAAPFRDGRDFQTTDTNGGKKLGDIELPDAIVDVAKERLRQGPGARRSKFDRVETQESQRGNRGIRQRSETLHDAASKTGGLVSAINYLKSFGLPPVAIRVGGAVLGQMSSDETLARNLAIYNTTTTAIPMMMHGAAGTDTANNLDLEANALFVQEHGAPLPEDARGNIYRSYTHGFAIGNTVASTIGVALSDLDLGSTANTALQSTVTSAAFYATGHLSANNAVRNLFAEQAVAGWSLQQPLENTAGEVVGNITTHKTPKALDDNTIEISKISLKHSSGRNINASIQLTSESDGVPPKLRLVPLERSGEVAPARTNSQRASDFVGNMLSTDHTAGKMTKVASFMSSVGFIQVLNAYVTPVLTEAFENEGKSAETAKTAAKIVMGTVGATLLGYDAVNKFMLFNQPTVDAEIHKKIDQSLAAELDSIRVDDGENGENALSSIQKDAVKSVIDQTVRGKLKNTIQENVLKTEGLRTPKGDAVLDTALRLSLPQVVRVVSEQIVASPRDRSKALESANTASNFVGSTSFDRAIRHAVSNALDAPDDAQPLRRTNVGKVGRALVPGVGGMLAETLGEARPHAPARLSNETFEPYAAMQAATETYLLDLRSDDSDPNSPKVFTETADQKLQINDVAALTERLLANEQPQRFGRIEV